MRITLTMAEDVAHAARTLAAAQGRSLGAVISDLAREGLRSFRGITVRNGFPVFDIPAGVSPLTPEMVMRALGDE